MSSQSKSRRAESLLNGRCRKEVVTQVAVAEDGLRRGQGIAAGVRSSGAVAWSSRRSGTPSERTVGRGELALHAGARG